MKKEHLIDELRARQVARDLGEEWQIPEASRAYQTHLWDGREMGWPVLHLEDVTGIPFLEGVTGVEEYQHRARVRAGDGDLFAAGTTPAEGYEDYCRETLGLGSPEFLQATDEDPSAVARACLTPEILDHLSHRAREAGGMVIHPYMSIQSVWKLADQVAGLSGSPVQVLGAPPPVLWIANDKARLSRLVEDTLGADWIVETHRHAHPEELAETLGDMARRHDWVGMKRTRCASAMGNLVLDARELRAATDQERFQTVERFLERTQWCGTEEVLVVEWRQTDLSPSTQLWIPPKGQGLPLLEGVYEQLLEGPEKVFLGSRPSTLPAPLNRAIGDASVQVCTALQELGYVGRCSFDFIVSGDVDGDFHAQITECNGRWGGTSTPMHLVDRLTGDPARRPSYVATDTYLPEELIGMDFPELKRRLRSELFDATTGQGRFVLYNVGPLKERGKFDVIALGESPDEARQVLEELLPELLGTP